MPGNDGVGHGQEVPVGAIAAFDLGLATPARHPFRWRRPGNSPTCRSWDYSSVSGRHPRVPGTASGTERSWRRGKRSPLSSLQMMRGRLGDRDRAFPLKRQEAGKPAFQGRPFRIECGKAFPDRGNFFIVGGRRHCHDDGLSRLSVGEPVADLGQQRLDIGQCSFDVARIGHGREPAAGAGVAPCRRRRRQTVQAQQIFLENVAVGQ